MLEGLKARKLGLKDLGSGDNKIFSMSTMKMEKMTWRHVPCGGKMREGRKLKNGVFVTWCPKCGTIWD